MTKEEYIEKVKELVNKTKPIFDELSIITKEFSKEHPEKSFLYDLYDIDRVTDYIILSGANIKDLIENHDTSKKDSFTYRIRKILGYLIP